METAIHKRELQKAFSKGKEAFYFGKKISKANDDGYIVMYGETMWFKPKWKYVEIKD